MVLRDKSSRRCKDLRKWLAGSHRNSKAREFEHEQQHQQTFAEVKSQERNREDRAKG